MNVALVPARRGHACLMAARAHEPFPLTRDYLLSKWYSSGWSRALIVNGRCVAIGGIVGTLLGDGACVWLVMSDEARRYPRILLRQGRQIVDSLVAQYGVIASPVIGDEACRFARHLGFVVGEETFEDSGISYRIAVAR